MTEYQMPAVQLGEIVLWYPGGNPGADPYAAIVSRTGSNNLCLSVIDPSSYNFLIRDGVRHLTDPRLSRTVEDREQGGWDYTPQHKRLQQLERQLLQVMDTKPERIRPTLDPAQILVGKAAK